MINIIEKIENKKIIGSAAKISLEVLKTIKTITSYKLDIIFDISDNIFDPNRYQEVNCVEDVFDNSVAFFEGIGDGFQKATVNVFKNAGHRIKDVLSTISNHKITNCIGDTIEEASNSVAQVIDDSLNAIGDGLNVIRMGLKKILF